MTTINEIWVFGDRRSARLQEMSFTVLSKAVALARHTQSRVVMFALTRGKPNPPPAAHDDTCQVPEPFEAAAIAWGAQKVILFENDHFSPPTPQVFAQALVPVFTSTRPRLVVLPLTDFGRELAARAAAALGAGLMADCLELTLDENETIVGRCPAWGGEIMAEITFTPGRGTGFATVAPHGPAGTKDAQRQGQVKRMPLTQIHEPQGLRLISSTPAPAAADTLENARVVVVGGAGLGSMENFSQVRRLAAALGGQVAATRPPVLSHWVSDDRLIGQTGKSVRPELLFSIATSGAVQYTAGIAEAGLIVAINRDPAAPIFKLADLGVVADAPTVLPLLSQRIRKRVMRRLTDDLCTDRPDQPQRRGFGERVRALREAQGWSGEDLAQATGQTPEYITEIESGAVSPPVAFLLRLAGAYGVDPGTFLRDEEKLQIRDQRTRDYVNRTRNYSYETLTSGAAHDHLRAFMVTIEPHHDHKPVAYKHDGEEFIFVMQGELQFTLGTKVHVLKTGESIHFHSATPHKLKSLSAATTRCLVILYTV
jgi:electron transfer flavoprotein alpha subunit/transcriptional regulator with XRE-family HTH domain